MANWEGKYDYHLKTDITFLQNVARSMRINLSLLIINPEMRNS